MNHPVQDFPPAAERPAIARRGVLQRGLAGADRGILLLLAVLPALALWSPTLLGA
jgi:hypothetical protein